MDGSTEGSEYYVISTRTPDNKAIDSMLDRAFGKARQKLEHRRPDGEPIALWTWPRLSMEIRPRIIPTAKQREAVQVIKRGVRYILTVGATSTAKSYGLARIFTSMAMRFPRTRYAKVLVLKSRREQVLRRGCGNHVGAAALHSWNAALSRRRPHLLCAGPN